VAEDDLRAAVEAQATAYVQGDMAAFASFMAPSAVLGLREDEGHRRPSPRRYRVVAVGLDGDDGRAEVEYSGRGGRFTLAGRWRREGGVWRCVEAAPEGVRHAWWARMTRGLRRPERPAERRERR
jgi:hypothetical protein